jgi:transcription-repair coupling factor (superfamily II helicase)
MTPTSPPPHPTTAADAPQVGAGHRWLGLPSVARLARFARHVGPAVLLTTADRVGGFRDAGVFAALTTVDPTLGDWHERHDKVVLTVEHALQAFPLDPEGYALTLRVGASVARDDLLDRLRRYGYERDEAPGYTVRGDAVELRTSTDPDVGVVRLEFFGDEVDGLTRDGAPLGAYTLGPRDAAALAAAEADDDDAAAAAWSGSVLGALPGTVYLDAPELYDGVLGDAAARLWGVLRGREVESFGRDPLPLEVGAAEEVTLGYYRAKLDDFAAEAETWLRDGYAVHVLLKFERTGRYLRERVLEHLDPAWHARVADRPGSLSFVLAPGTHGGYRDPGRREVVVTEDLLYGAQGGRRLKRLPGRAVHDAAQLTVGDYLIHPDHGIARFQGLEARQVVGATRDYLVLRYAGEGKLYLPVEQLPLLRRHPGTTDDPPRLSTLGTNEWARARERARVNAEAMAAELIKTYAARQVAEGLAFPDAPEWAPMVERNFPYVLTPDQRIAVEATLADMARPVPMDRLISGDVGFGKTEVAIRAAFRAVANGHQVAMMVPTTVLAQQHFETFAERFAGLPVRVEVLSRFSSDREAKGVVDGLADGRVDVVIGTHRLLGEGVRFKRLGLLVVDEEHRFGVGQKERLKALRAHLDVLSLSATPIPRTLYMSLVGLRDVSQIMTPPEGRQPIQTLLQPYDPMTVRQAIMFELERGGKTYYIHDRIGSMGMRAKTLAQLVPEARIGVAHGQMAADDLEGVMLGFQEGAFDVLLATTIVESGLDVAGANTLLIERADRLGLAQLYQLRGRVGRRRTEAWAYMFYPARLSETAQRRLYAIAELNDLGSGHLLAEKDMEIRGVGNLLGPEQHGQISAVSLEVYTELLAEEIAKLKGEAPKEVGPPPVAIDLGLDARLSPSYVVDDDERIAMYGRFAEAAGLAEISGLARTLREAYGPFPTEVKNFVELAKLRLLAAGKGVATIQAHLTDVQVSFHRSDIDYDPRAVRELGVQAERTTYPPGFSLKRRGVTPERMLQAVVDLLYACG